MIASGIEMLQVAAKISNGNKKSEAVVKTAKKASSDSDSSEDEVIHRIYLCSLVFFILFKYFF